MALNDLIQRGVVENFAIDALERCEERLQEKATYGEVFSSKFFFLKEMDYIVMRLMFGINVTKEEQDISYNMISVANDSLDVTRKMIFVVNNSNFFAKVLALLGFGNRELMRAKYHKFYKDLMDSSPGRQVVPKEDTLIYHIKKHLQTEDSGNINVLGQVWLFHTGGTVYLTTYIANYKLSRGDCQWVCWWPWYIVYKLYNWRKKHTWRKTMGSNEKKFIKVIIF
jgi:hypothetical protein